MGSAGVDEMHVDDIAPLTTFQFHNPNRPCFTAIVPSGFGASTTASGLASATSAAATVASRFAAAATTTTSATAAAAMFAAGS
jgi:hypothetical protein